MENSPQLNNQHPRINQAPLKRSQSRAVLIAIILSVVITALVVGTGVYAWVRYERSKSGEDVQASVTPNGTISTSPTNQVLGTLQTYTNPRWQFSFQYPESWQENTRCGNKTRDVNENAAVIGPKDVINSCLSTPITDSSTSLITISYYGKALCGDVDKQNNVIEKCPTINDYGRHLSDVLGYKEVKIAPQTVGASLQGHLITAKSGAEGCREQLKGVRARWQRKRESRRYDGVRARKESR